MNTAHLKPPNFKSFNSFNYLKPQRAPFKRSRGKKKKSNKLQLAPPPTWCVVMNRQTALSTGHGFSADNPYGKRDAGDKRQFIRG